jgi:hypothetical protein
MHASRRVNVDDLLALKSQWEREPPATATHIQDNVSGTSDVKDCLEQALRFASRIAAEALRQSAGPPINLWRLAYSLPLLDVRGNHCVVNLNCRGHDYSLLTNVMEFLLGFHTALLARY